MTEFLYDSINRFCNSVEEGVFVLIIQKLFQGGINDIDGIDSA